MRKDRARRKRNLAVVGKLKEAVKKASKKPTEDNVAAAFSIIDKTAKTHLIHHNKAARIKSKLTRLITATAKKSTPGARKDRLATQSV